MKFFKKPIFTGFAPNLTRQDLKIAGAFLFLPWKWPYLKQGKNVGMVERWLANYFQTKFAFTFDSGRTALYFALKSLGVGEGDEVLVQSYTCLVVINAIKWTGAKPIYVDVEDNFNMSAIDLNKKITPQAKILIIQHTFGQPADLNNLLNIAREHNLKVVEDCAHSLGAKYNGKLTGTFGEIGMFSFGSDKVLSCVRGGALTLNDRLLAEKIQQYQKTLPQTSLLKIFQHLWHYPFFYFCKPIYNLGVGKWVLALAKKLNIFNKIIYPAEKRGLPVVFYPAKFPNALASILLWQFKTLEKTITHSQMIAKYYHDHLKNSLVAKPIWSDASIWLRYTILVEEPVLLMKQIKKEGIILGNWYDAPIAPKNVDLKHFDYEYGSCPHDEKLAQKSLNLPTSRHISLADAKRIADFINDYAL